MGAISVANHVLNWRTILRLKFFFLALDFAYYHVIVKSGKSFRWNWVSQHYTVHYAPLVVFYIFSLFHSIPITLWPVSVSSIFDGRGTLRQRCNLTVLFCFSPTDWSALASLPDLFTFAHVFYNLALKMCFCAEWHVIAVRDCLYWAFHNCSGPMIFTSS